MLINTEQKKIKRQLTLIGVLHALFIMFIPPFFHDVLRQINDMYFLILTPTVLSLIGIFFIIKILYAYSEYIKFLYAMRPFFSWFITVIICFFTGIYGVPMSIVGIISESSWDWSILGYWFLLIFNYIAAFIASIVSYVILLTYKYIKKRKTKEKDYEKENI